MANKANGCSLSATTIKICGLTNLADARFVAQTGADLLGFIFYEPSPRYIAPQTVREIIATLQVELIELDHPPRYVGVFVNAARGFIEETIALCGLDLVQLHGGEPPEVIDHFQGRAFKAIKPRSLAEAETGVQRYLEETTAPFILLDTYHPHLHGGTGQTADWAIAVQIAKKHPLLLAGGLHPDNVAQAIETVRPWGVDASSGLEATKSKKDHAKVKTFVEIVKQITQL